MRVVQAFAFAGLQVFAAAAASAGVWVVDDDGGAGTIASIQAAVALAADGDSILVRSGTYAPVTIDGLDLDVIADDGAHVVVLESVTVRNLAPWQSVLLRGLRVEAPASTWYAVQDLPTIEGCIRAETVAGRLVVEGCTLRGSRACVRAQDANVHLERVDALAGPAFIAGLFVHEQAGVGVDAADSVVTLDRCIVVGGAGYNSNLGIGDGGAALRVSGGESFAVGSLLTGGKGNDAAYAGLGICLKGGHGGPGLIASGTTPLRVAACAIAGGPGGLASPPAPIACPAGNAGAATVLENGAVLVDTQAAAARGVTAAGPTRVGQVVTLTFTGVPGDQVFLFWGPSSQQTAFPQYDHSLLATPATMVALGPLPSPTWVVPAVMGPIAGGGLLHVVHAQVAVIAANGDLALGGATTIVAVDPSL